MMGKEIQYEKSDGLYCTVVVVFGDWIFIKLGNTGTELDNNRVVVELWRKVIWGGVFGISCYNQN